MTKVKKSAKKPTAKELQKRIREACEILTDLTMTLDEDPDTNGTADEAVRVLLGKDYDKFVAKAVAEREPGTCGSRWYTGDEWMEDKN